MNTRFLVGTLRGQLTIYKEKLTTGVECSVSKLPTPGSGPARPGLCAPTVYSPRVFASLTAE